MQSTEQQAPTPQSAPSPASPASGAPRWGRAVLIAAIVGLLVGGGIAAAIVLLGGEDSKQASAPAAGGASTVPVRGDPVPIRSGEASSSQPAPDDSTGSTVGSIEPGRYIQAGSFRTVEGAETEQLRLREQGIDVDVVDSDQAQELYPGFQVLLGGPFSGPGSERSTLGDLRENGVPSAFARTLSPAAAISGSEALDGVWSGTLERTGTSRPGLNGSLPVTLTAEGEGDLATLEFSAPQCTVDLQLREATSVALTYGQPASCVGGGAWHLRPDGNQLSVVLLPPDTDVIVIGTLSRH